MDIEYGPQGIGGWLILPAIALIFTPFRMLFQLYRDVLPVMKQEVWGPIFDASSPAYHPALGVFMIVEQVANLALFVFTLRLAWLFFHKSKRVPRLFIIWQVVTATVVALDLAISNQILGPEAGKLDPDEVRDLIRSMIACMIWIPYFLKSERVANTFIEPVEERERIEPSADAEAAA